MAATIRIGFPLRRCSWSFRPIVPAQPTRAMIRWLDSVCLKRGAEDYKALAKTRVIIHAT